MKSSRRKRTSEEKKIIRERVLKEKSQELRQRRLFNRFFHKSLYFKSSLTIRIIYIVLFILGMFFHYKSFNCTEERVNNKNIEKYKVTRGRPYYTTITKYELTFETESGNYSSDITGQNLPLFNIGDTIIIERNILFRPIYFYKSQWSYKYGFSIQLGFYYIPFFLSILSLFFYDGFYRATFTIINIASLLSISGLVSYLLF